MRLCRSLLKVLPIFIVAFYSKVSDLQASPLAIGSYGAVSGELRPVVIDDIAHRSERIEYKLLPSNGDSPITVRFPHGKRIKIPKIQKRVYVRGMVTGDSSITAVALSINLGDSSNGPLPVAQKKFAFILVNFSDTAVSCSTDQVQNLVFAENGYSTKTVYKEVSNGAFNIDGAVFEAVTIPYQQSNSCTHGEYDLWATAANAELAARGVDLSQFTNFFYVMPPACGFGGLGYPGGDRAWGFYCGRLAVYNHEIGHNLGMDHANANGTEYFDFSDFMSSTWSIQGLNAPHREQLGWINPGKVVTISRPSNFTISSLDAPSTLGDTTPQIVKIPRPEGDYLYLSYRTGAGTGVNLTSSYKDLLNIHAYGRANDAHTNLLSVLSDGNKYFDPSSTLVISVDSHTDSTVTGRISFGCVHKKPTITFDPPLTYIRGEGDRTVNVIVKNNDAPECKATSFDLSSEAISGVSVVEASKSITLEPGSMGSTSLTIHPRKILRDGQYKIVFNASDASNLTHAGAGTALWIMDKTAPEAPSKPVLGKIWHSIMRLSWRSIKDPSGIASYSVYANGKLVSKVTDNAALIRIPKKRGRYAYTVIATDRSGNRSESSVPRIVLVR